MEHREPPRIVTAEDASRAPGIDREPVRRFSRFVPSPSVRRIALPRLVLAVLAAAGALGVLFVVGRLTVNAFVGYLHRQSEYEFAFRDITLEPAPPAWFRGGKEAFLERVRARDALPEKQSLLDLDLKRLELAFQHDCWVKKVERLEYRTFPNRVIIHLSYREPVALVEQSDRSKNVRLDAEGVILPAEDVNWDLTAPQVRMYVYDGKNLRPPWNPKFGETWKKAGSAGEPEVDKQVESAAKLAALLGSARASDRERDSFDLEFVVLVRVDRLWVQYGDRVFVWQKPPGVEPVAGLTADAKWALLRDWIVNHRESIRPYRTDEETPRIVYSITKTGVVKGEIPPNRGARSG